MAGAAAGGREAGVMAALNFLVLRTFVVLHIPVAHCDWWERNLA